MQSFNFRMNEGLQKCQYHVGVHFAGKYPKGKKNHLSSIQCLETHPTTRHCNKDLAKLIKTIPSHQLKTIPA